MLPIQALAVVDVQSVELCLLDAALEGLSIFEREMLSVLEGCLPASGEVADELRLSSVPSDDVSTVLRVVASVSHLDRVAVSYQ
jgi:hypothetical protein